MIGRAARTPEQPATSDPSVIPSVARYPLQPGSSGAYVVLGGVFLMVMLGSTLPTPLYVLYEARFGFSAPTVTLIFAAYAVGVLATLLTIGRISDQLGRRPVLLAALAVAAVSTLLFIVAQETAVLYIARILSGVGVGLTTGTATAALSELHPRQNRARAASLAAAVNLGGLGLGPVVAGLFGEYLGVPLRLVYLCYLGALLPTAVGVVLIPETVPRNEYRSLSVRPEVAVPAGMRSAFAGASLGAFAAFTLMGLFTSLVPSFLGHSLHEPNRAVEGAVVGLLFLAAAISQLALRPASTVVAAVGGLVLLLPALATIELGLALAQLGILLAGTVIGGIATGATFMGALATVNSRAPADRHAAVVAAFFLVAYTGLTLPVIGVGIATQHVSTLAATAVCAGALAVLSMVSLVAVVASTRRARPAVS